MSIGIASVLNEINQPIRGDRVHTFSITFIRTTDGKTGAKGSEKKVATCQKYSKDILQTGGSRKRPKAMPNLRASNMLMLRDMTTNEIIHVKIFAIIRYNSHPVQH